MFEQIIKATLGFAVFILILFGAYSTTKFIAGKTAKTLSGRNIKIIETLNLGIDKRLLLVKVGKEYFLIASAGKNIEFLSSVDMGDEDLSETNIKKTETPFEKFLKRYLTKDIKRKDLKKDSGDTGDLENGNDKKIVVSNRKGRFKENLERLKSITSNFNRKDREDSHGKQD